MLGGKIKGTVEILKTIINSKAYKVIALTNWSSETFPIAKKHFQFSQWFDGIVVSGDEKTRKPFKYIFDITLNRFNIKAENSIFIDDNEINTEAYNNHGFNSIYFK